ncbi:1-phosphofructokinase [Dendrosporobacter sp. 1207_IL3150]|uniref:1-phosphofructokinase n=1 Tax=Dendrosporobacter sp. 1207_IL3150 TaxID=3084054 RepID=UPI002FD9B8FE
MIITVTLNPAIDKTIVINDFRINSVNRISSTRLDAGGKGINVSKTILTLNGKSKAIGIAAGNAGRFIQDYLNAVNIEQDFVSISGETRTNIKIIDPVNKTNTDINEAGPDILMDDLESVKNKLLSGIDDKSVVVFSGSVPSNVPNEVYRQWIASAKEKGAKTILDADGDLLKLALEASPYMIKPNIHELERLFNKKINTIEDAIEIAVEIINKYKVENVVISMGEKGALFIKKDCYVLAHGLKVEVKSTVGAGDAMVAALAYSIDQGYSFEDTIKLAVACGTANVMTSGTEPSTLETIMQLEKQVTWEFIQ